MSDRAQELLKEALALSARERADVAAELLASLDQRVDDDPAAVTAAWDEEIDRRVIDDLPGRTPGESWRGLRARLTSML